MFPGRATTPTTTASSCRLKALSRGLLFQADVLVAVVIGEIIAHVARSAAPYVESGNAEEAEALEHGGPGSARVAPLGPWTHRRWNDLLNLLAMLDGQLEALNDAVTQAAKQYPNVRLLMSQPGVGAVTALVFVLTVGDVRRFPRGKQVASYLGLIPREHSSGGKQRMGGISKQDNRVLRFLSVEAANIAVRFDPELPKECLHRCHHKHVTVAKVAAARKLAIRMYWMLRTQTLYPQVLSSRVA